MYNVLCDETGITCSSPYNKTFINYFHTNRKKTWKRHRLKFVDITLYFHPLQWKVVAFLQRFVISMINVLQNLYSQYCFGLSALRLHDNSVYSLDKKCYRRLSNFVLLKTFLLNMSQQSAILSGADFNIFLSLKRKKKERNIW